jgi:hypothetical protein
MGATSYNMLTGAYPYPFNEKRDPIDVILNEEVVPIRKRDKSIPESLAGVLDQALTTKTKSRFQNASEFLVAIGSAFR